LAVAVDVPLAEEVDDLARVLVEYRADLLDELIG